MMERNLLIVDDDPYILVAIRELFEDQHCNVYAMSKGQDCLTWLKNGLRGVILMDVMMPHMDGWDTIKAIVDQRLYEGNIISMFTAKDIPDTKMDALQEYVADYITKPFDPEELVALVNSYFEKDISSQH
jgi:DNA-binding response OmpR family regulator